MLLWPRLSFANEASQKLPGRSFRFSKDSPFSLEGWIAIPSDLEVSADVPKVTREEVASITTPTIGG